MSKSTQSSATAKTRLVPKPLGYGLVGVAVLALILPFFFVGHPTATLKSGGKAYQLEIVSTAAVQEKGLGDRQHMAADKGMLFVFGTSETQCIWMKDMQFPLDILWLDNTKTVVKVAENVAPSTYPEKYCTDSTKYVIELNAGAAKQADIRVGRHLQL